MATRRRHSVTAGLAISIVAAGVLLSVGAGYLTWQRQALIGAETAGQAAAIDPVRERIAYQTLLIAAATLSSLLLVRRWITQPLEEVVELVDVGARSEPFFDLARHHQGEFRRLALALGELVEASDHSRRRWLKTAAEPPAPAAVDPSRVSPGHRSGEDLRVFHRVGPALAEAEHVDALLERTVEHLFDQMGVEAVGMAVRAGGRGRRARQVLHRGCGGHLLEANRALVQRVEESLLPDALAQPQMLFWPDLDVAGTGWSQAFVAAGLTCLAAVGVHGSHDAQGVLWIARRGGNRLDPQALRLLESLAPVVAARLELAQLRERLQGLHLVDPVTDLPSHVQFEQAMGNTVGRPGQPCALLVIDLDRFADHNQHLGRAGGDALLRAVATRLLAVTRRSSFLARFAGASFGLIMPDVDAAAAEKLAQRLTDVLAREPFAIPVAADASEMPVREVRVTASIGVACFPDDGLRSDDLLDLALIRVAAAKRTGRNRAVTHTVPDPSRQAG